MTEHEGHRARLRRRYLQNGLDAFPEDYEVLELLLQFAILRQDTKGQAKQLIEHFGSLHEVLDATPDELMNTGIPGIRENAAVLLTMISQLERRYALSRERGRNRVRGTSDAGAVCTALFRNRRDESVWMLCLNAGGRIIKQAEIAKGDVNAVHFPVRKIAETALAAKAVSVILAHNHPGGTLMASREDLDATAAAGRALETVGVRLLDHLIVSGDNYCSLREEGLLQG